MVYKKLKYWFDKNLAVLLAEKIQKVYELFDSKGFIQKTTAGVNDLELKLNCCSKL